MTKFKVKGSLDNITYSLEFDRGTSLNLNAIKRQLEAKVGGKSLGLRYKFSDGHTQPLLQDFHLQDALKDAERSKAKSLQILLKYDSPSPAPSSATTSSSSYSSSPSKSNIYSPSPASSPAAPSTRFCDQCGTTLSGAAKFCSSCGNTVGSSPSPSPASGSISPRNPEESTGCGGCGKPIVGGAAKALGKIWHKECFVCMQCHKSVVSSSFVEEDGKPLCTSCYEETYAKRCTKCNQPIDGPYLNIEGKEYHKDCFICNKCGSQFDGGYFFKDGQAVCKNCIR